MSMGYFVRATDPIMRYSSEDVVLDVGCGAGYLHEELKDRVQEIHGVDIAQRYLDYCKVKFEHFDNCHFRKLDENHYTDLGFLPEKRFTKIVCLSVIQYYERETDLEGLVRSVQRVAAPGALCLISDIPMRGATGGDAWSLLGLALKEQHLFDTLGYLLKMRFSEYHDVRAREGVVYYPVDGLNQLAADMGLDAEVLTDQLTVNKSRCHWLIRF